jgi:hypothetical protein
MLCIVLDHILLSWYVNCLDIQVILVRIIGKQLQEHLILKKTMKFGLFYNNFSIVLEGYIDASWITSTSDNKPTSGWVFILGGGVVSWASKKQICITYSTMKFKFIALAATGKETKWLRNMLLDIKFWS